MPLASPISRILLYVKDIPKVADFYIKHFGFVPQPSQEDDLLELTSASGSFSLLLHQASKGHRVGQSCIKIIFDVHDVEAFKGKALKQGLKFGMTYKADRYEFANARDPAKNPIQISSRTFRK
jgi:predicted enzyme related to lactoylglutathione lyase